MKHNLVVLTYFFIASAMPGLSRAEALSWSVDSAHSRVGFSVTHFGINTVYGSFTKYDAVVIADASGKLGEVTATVHVASINTGNEKRDGHLRAPDLFHVAQYPTIEVTAKKINWSGKKLSGTASMTIKGKSLPVRFTGRLTGTKTVTENGKQVMRAGYVVSAEINRTKFGLDFGGITEALGMVGEAVTITLNIETTRPI
jgi:polyisoprenoid-binding protein YceI